MALNCVANGKLLRRGPFDDLWIQPAAGDAGGALGAALAVHHLVRNEPRPAPRGDAMRGSYLGPAFDTHDIERTARHFKTTFAHYADADKLCNDVAGLLAQGNVVGWFQGRMEYGPRALGARSILGDPRNPEMQKKLNLKIKYREGVRPFAPSVLEEDISEFFDLDRPSPYMLLVAPVLEKQRKLLPDHDAQRPMYERLYTLRSDLPAITHVDFSARIQSVNKNVNPRFHHLLSSFKALTGFGVLVNTSFNVRGEPIVCTPEEAYACLMRTEMDYLVMENFLFAKADQPAWKEKLEWCSRFMLD